LSITQQTLAVEWLESQMRTKVLAERTNGERLAQKRKAAKVALRCSPACTLPQVLRHLVKKISNYILTSGTCHANLHVFASQISAYLLPHAKSETYSVLPSAYRPFRIALDVAERRA